MGNKLKQLVIYLGLFLVCITFTLIAPFYPKIAREKGIPLWVIGIIFSLSPLGNMGIGLILGKYLNVFGRKRVIFTSFLLISTSLLILSPIEYLDTDLVIVLSVVSRVLGGMGISCQFITVTTVFISEYPDKIQIMISRMESCISFGLIVGPILGAGIYSLSLLTAMPCLSGVILVYSGISWKYLGEFKEYNEQAAEIDRKKLFIKPVFFIQKIILSLLMNFSYLFNLGFLASMIESHLSSYGLSTFFISFCLTLVSSVYFLLSLTGGYVLRRLDNRIIMLVGQSIFVIAYLLFAPWTLIFPNRLWVVIASLPCFSFGQNLSYSDIYLVYSISFMVRSAVNDYGYQETDILKDTISAFAAFGCAFGEIIGPIYGGFVVEFLGMENCCLIASGMSLFNTVVFGVGTGLFFDVFRKRKNNRLVENEQNRGTSLKKYNRLE